MEEVESEAWRGISVNGYGGGGGDGKVKREDERQTDLFLFW